MNDLIDRLWNVHSLKAIGIGLAGFGLITPESVDAAVNQAQGNVYVLAIGLGLYLLSQLLRRA